jgi:hypothetical protein
MLAVSSTNARQESHIMKIGIYSHAFSVSPYQPRRSVLELFQQLSKSAVGKRPAPAENEAVDDCDDNEAKQSKSNHLNLLLTAD